MQIGRFALLARGVHGNGKPWDPMGPMGFPWEWERFSIFHRELNGNGNQVHGNGNAVDGNGKIPIQPFIKVFNTFSRF